MRTFPVSLKGLEAGCPEPLRVSSRSPTLMHDLLEMVKVIMAQADATCGDLFQSSSLVEVLNSTLRIWRQAAPNGTRRVACLQPRFAKQWRTSPQAGLDNSADTNRTPWSLAALPLWCRVATRFDRPRSGRVDRTPADCAGKRTIVPY